MAEIEERILQLERNLADLEATLTRSLQELEHRKVNERLSANAVRGWGFAEGQETGNDRVAVYDMEGKLHLYRLVESPVYGQGDNHYPNGSQAESVVEGETSRLVLEADGSFRWLHKDGGIWEYGVDGLLERIQDRNNNQLEILYDTDRRAVGIHGNGHPLLRLVWNNGRIVAIESLRDTGERVAYSYSGILLTGVVDTDGDRVAMEYDSAMRLVALRKGDGSVVAFTHGLEAADGSVLTTATTNEEGHTETFRYDRAGRTTTYTSHSGEVTTYHYDDSHRTTRRTDSDGTVTEWVYDSRGNATATTVNGDTTTHSHDAAGNLISTTYSDGSRETWSYDGYGLPLSHSDRDGVAERWERDGRGNVTAYLRGGRRVWTATYDSHGQVTSTTVYGGSTVTTSYQYDQWGNMTSRSTAGMREEWEHDGRNRVTAYKVDGQLQASYEYREKTATELLAGGLERVYTWSSRKDLISIEETDTATGETVTYAYDRAGRRILMAGAGRETAYRYGRNGELLEVSDNRQRLSVAYKYDVMGRETERIFGNGVSQHTVYDKAGRVILITEKSGNNILLRGEGYVYDSLGRRSTTVSHTGAVTRYEYNPAGQLAKVQYPDSQELRDLQEKEARQHGLFWQEGVSGLSNGHLSTGEYTELSRLFVRMRNGGGFLPTTQVFRTEMYTYDANGNR
ncbi:MAG: hypothetical protein SOU88_01990, partial [Candidatus Treponema excrementipullorum]|nr:hypothetical protein [Candidatus Treponema excrementipullorum]